MKKTGLLGFLLSPIFLFIFIISLVLFSGSLLMAENDETQSYFNAAPSIQHLSNTSIEVNWNMYPDSDFSTHYQVMLDHVYYGHSTKNLKQICNKITPGSKLDVRVVTFHKGEFCGISSTTKILMRPAAPKSIKVYDVATSSFGILWSGVESATSYNVYNGDTIIGSKEESGTDNKLTFSGFEPGSTLKVSMTSINSSGESPKSDPIMVELVQVASLTLKIPNNSITATSFKVKWDKQKFAKGYKVFVNDGVVATLSADITEYDVTNLDAGTSVSVKIGLLNSAGDVSATSDSIIVQLKPDAPVLTATDISSFSCILTWSVANGANNYKIFENGDNAIYNVPSTITNVTVIEGVNPGSTVFYKVRAVNDIGESEDSNIVEVHYLPKEPTVTDTQTNTNTETQTQTQTSTDTGTNTNTSTGTETNTNTNTSTSTTTNTNTNTSTNTDTSTNTSINTSISLAPNYPNKRLLSSSFKIPEAHFSDALKEKLVIAVYFPKKLKGAELALEVEYLEMLAETPELSNVRFYAIFTNEVAKRDKSPENMRFLKAKASDKLVIPGKLPVVRFYAQGGILRSEIVISIPILTVTDVYKALPEALEKRSKLTHLYHE